MAEYSLEVIAAASRVATRLADGFDRCDGGDFDILHVAGLVDAEVCTDTFGLDSIEIGETVYRFNAAGDALVVAMFSPNEEDG